MKLIFKISVFIVLASLSSCIPIDTDNPNKAFKYWAGFSPPEKFKVIKGEYYQSPHFTLEYTAIFKLHPNYEWWSKLVKQNMLSRDNTKWNRPSDLPDWFRPSEKSIMYSNHDEFDDSRYFEESETGVIYIYEVQY